MDNDKLIELIAKREDGTITKEERSLLNKAEWAARHKHVEANLTPARSPIGTVAGNKQRVQEFKDMLMGAVVGGNVIRKILDIALNDDHPGQLAALKMCIDRQLPMSAFEARKDSARTAITITISGVGDSPQVIDSDDITDV